jgi:hypothetical protein
MNPDTKELLMRWRSIESGKGLKRARSHARTLWLVGFGLCVFVALAVLRQLHPGLIAAAAAAMGWVIAESNALLTRVSQWPTIRSYIDWKRVESDLANANGA